MNNIVLARAGGNVETEPMKITHIESIAVDMPYQEGDGNP
jgi:hypothetical protein|tara:strand:+ start:2101 stop:2220 length:120 start_codon:yes stop_codon:yes gene_type:complete